MATAIEYGLIAALVSVGMIAAMQSCTEKKPSAATSAPVKKVGLLDPSCRAIITDSQGQTFLCPKGSYEGAVTRPIGPNDDPACFIDNSLQTEKLTFYSVVCSQGARFDPKQGQPLGLYYRG